MSVRSERAGISERVAARRARFRESVARISEKAQSAELLRMLLLPGALSVMLGFAFMFFGWYGAARTPREIEQIPYLISGGFIGMALVFVGGLLLASAFWMGMLRKFSEEAEDRAEQRIAQAEARLREQMSATRPRSSTTARKHAGRKR